MIVQNISDSLARCAPFSESLLLVAFEANKEEVQHVLSKAVKQVLSAPINKADYAWFWTNVFPSSVWLQRDREGNFMFEHMLRITKSMTEKIDLSMRSIYEHQQEHREWSKVVAIQNQVIVARQDDARVGLLQGNGIRDVLDVKQQDDADLDLAGFTDSNLAVNMLITTAKQINAEFQGRVKAVMSRFGDVHAGSVKSVERCQSKLENDYVDAEYPKAARLLDLVRCSVSFNTVEQLLTGYEGLMRHISRNPDSLQLARVKNGFLGDTGAGSAFRDLKVNVVFHSEHDPEHQVSMVCEVQLILNQFLHEKKRVHKL